MKPTNVWAQNLPQVPVGGHFTDRSGPKLALEDRKQTETTPETGPGLPWAKAHKVDRAV